MSQLTYIASNTPLSEVKNAHYKTLSVNEALSEGIEVDDFLLRPGYNRDEPNVILWSDTKIVFDTDAGTVDDGNFDDDFAILRLSDATEDVYTEKKYRAYIEWRCTAGRAQNVIDYIHNQLELTDEIELWHIWMGNEDRPRIRKRTIPIDELTPDDVIELEAMDILSDPPTQYCLVIINRESRK